MNALRRHYHHQIDEIDNGLSLGLALVEEAVAASREAFLGGDDARRVVDTRQQEVRAIGTSLESMVLTQLARQAPVAGELRHLVAVLRIVPEMELTASLAGNIARRGAARVGSGLPPTVRGTVTALFDQATAMWHLVAGAYGQPNANIGHPLDALSAEIASLHACLVAELTSAPLRPAVLVDMALVARFLERLGDHAVEVGDCIESLTSFELSLGR